MYVLIFITLISADYFMEMIIFNFSTRKSVTFDL